MLPDFRQRLQQGERLIGTMVTIGSREIAEVLGEVGFDWLCLDGEHGALEPSVLQGLLQAINRNVAVIVRVPALDEADIKHALDIGATGVMVPQVHTAEHAALAVRWSRYPPLGARGVGVARAQHYGFRVAEYLEHANEQVTVIVQAESGAAVDNIDSIVRVPGVDAVLIGPYDLSASLGHPGELSHPTVQAAITRVAEACQGVGLPLGIFGLSATAVRPYPAPRFRLMLVGVDTVLLGQSARELLHAAREA